MKSQTVSGETVIALRELAGLNQAQLAEKCGITRAYMSQIENGLRQPSAPVAAEIARHLGVEIGNLAGERVA